MSTIKISELATTDISLTDFIAKADATGLATKNTLQGLSNFLSTAGDVSFKGSLAIADVPDLDGWYFASESGTYTNAGGLVIDISNQLVIIIVSATYTVFSKVDIPLNITFDATPTDASTNAVESEGILNFVASKKGFSSFGNQFSNNIFNSFNDITIEDNTGNLVYYLKYAGFFSGTSQVLFQISDGATTTNFYIDSGGVQPTTLQFYDVTIGNINLKVTFDWTTYTTVYSNATNNVSITSSLSDTFILNSEYKGVLKSTTDADTQFLNKHLRNI
mgnify:CR=1 FL=1